MSGGGASPAADVTRVVVRPVGTPLPVGFLGLLVATVGFSALQLGWLPPEQGRNVAIGVLVLTVPSQLLAAVIGFLARDPVAGTGMTLLAGTWAAAGAVTAVAPPGAASPGLGVLFLAAAAAMAVPAAAGMTKLAAGGIMALTSVRFALTGAAELTGSPTWTTAAGVAGLVLAVAAFYAALAFELEGAKRRTVLPTGRRGAGGGVMSDTVEDELAPAVHEPGVRRQL